MTMAAVIDNRTAQVSARPHTSGIARVDVLSDLTAAEPVWRVLEQRADFSTAYQRFDLLSAWQHEIGTREGASPYIVIALDAEQRPLLLLPLALTLTHGVRVAAFMGGKHTTFNLGLWDPDFAATATPADLARLLAELRHHGRADVLALTRQPLRWHELANPFAQWPHQPSVNDCPLLSVASPVDPTALISNSFRKRLRAKEKKLQVLSGYRCYVADTDAEITRLLDWFFKVKPLRMAEQKLPDVFAEPGVEVFVRQACMAKLPSGRRAIEIHALDSDDEVIALFAGVADGERFSMMFNTYTLSEHARWSPGLILMRNIIDHYAALNYRALDLGIGSDEYKRLFCKSDEPIFDSFIPLTWRGRPAADAMSAVNRAKRLVKRNPALFDLAQNLRSMFR